jgi:hypothetical protein
MPAVAQKTRLNREDQQTLARLISLEQTGGHTESAPIDRDFLLADGNFDLFFLHYFPNDFDGFEKLDYDFLNFLENENQGMAWLPAGHGKSSCIMHWIIYSLCREPQLSFIYCEKSEPAAQRRAKGIMDILEFNKDLVHDFGEFKGKWWSADAITIKQRPKISQWPSIAFFGAQSKATLGSRCNIMIVDDPVTADNSSSELERVRLRDWYSQAASTCPYPLPLSRNDRYLRKLFLVGTTFHMDDLYHTVLKSDMYKILHLPAVNLRTGETLSPRFTYRSTEDLKGCSNDNAADADMLRKVTEGRITSLGDYRKSHGTKAFMRRYQNEVRDDSTAKFPEPWFRGGVDEWSPPGGYPGCLEDGEMRNARSLGEVPKGTFTIMTGVDPFGGSKGVNTARFACVTLGCDLVHDPNTVHLIDLDFGTQPMVSDNEKKTSQMDIVARHIKDFGGRVILEVNNVQGVWAQVLRQEASKRGMLITVTSHHTSSEKKVDPQQGIEAMAAMIENGNLRLPYGDTATRKAIDELIEEFTYWGFYGTDDILMAFWFAWRALDKVRRNRRTRPVVLREKKPYMFSGDKHHFNPAWSATRIHNYLHPDEMIEEPDDEERE